MSAPQFDRPWNNVNPNRLSKFTIFVSCITGELCSLMELTIFSMVMHTYRYNVIPHSTVALPKRAPLISRFFPMDRQINSKVSHPTQKQHVDWWWWMERKWHDSARMCSYDHRTEIARPSQWDCALSLLKHVHYFWLHALSSIKSIAAWFSTSKVKIWVHIFRLSGTYQGEVYYSYGIV